MNQIPPIPPTDLIIAACRDLLAPASLAVVSTVVVFGLIVWFIAGKFQWNWRRAMPAVFVLALTASIVAVNHFRGNPFPWVPDGKWWHWAAPVIAACLATEFINSCVNSRKYAFLLRGLVAGLASHYLVPAAWLAESQIWLPFVAIWLVISWTIIAELARKQPGGAVSLAGSFFAAGSGVVLLHALSLGLSDISNAIAVALFLIAIMAWITKSHGSAGFVATVCPVLILIWLNRPIADSNVPVTCHRILGAVPLWLGILLLPGLNRYLGTRIGGVFVVLLTLIPVAIAVSLAVFNAPMNFEEEKW